MRSFPNYDVLAQKIPRLDEPAFLRIYRAIENGRHRAVMGDDISANPYRKTYNPSTKAYLGLEWESAYHQEISDLFEVMGAMS